MTLVRKPSPTSRALVAIVAAAATQAFEPLAMAQSPFDAPSEAIISVGRLGSEVVRDFDGDGNLDVLKNVPGIGALFLYKGLGGGDFALSGNILAPGVTAGASEGAASDLDGDGDVDLIVQGFASEPLRRLINDGAGQFTVEDLGIGGGPWSSARFIDVNGDGAEDLVLWSSALSGRDLHWVDGRSGTFAGTPQQFLFVPSEEFLTDDIDGDGNLDFFARASNGGLRVAFGQGGISYGAFAPLAGAASQAVFPLSIRDINGDGYGDIFAARPNGLRYFRATGPRSYAAPVFLAPSLMSTNLTQFVDLDGDSDLDVLHLTAQSFSLNSPGPTETQTFLQTAPGVFASGPVSGASISNLALVKDLDGDGDGDLIASSVEGLQWQLGDAGSGADYFGPLQSANLAIAAPSSHELVDLDQDGDPDVVVTSGDEQLLGWVENLGGGEFAEPAVIASVDTEPERTLAVDFDADGDADLIVLRDGNTSASKDLDVLINDGSGGFSLLGQGLSIAASSVPELFARDVDADGNLDLLIHERVGFTPGAINLYLGDGLGSFAAAASPIPGIQGLFDFAAGDLNNDGMPDVAALAQTGPGLSFSVTLALNAGNGNFAVVASQPVTGSGSAVRLNDLNGDGETDILVTGDIVQLFAGDGTGLFPAGVPLGTAVVRDPQLVDLDLDGDLDMYSTTNPSGNTQWSERDSSGIFTPPVDLFTEGARRAEATKVIDLDGDGDLDAVVLNPEAPFGALFRIYDNNTLAEIGAAFCDTQIVNSTGAQGALSAYGSEDTGVASVQLMASALPANQFVLFVGSRTFGSPMPIPNSMGLLCVDGAIGRYQGPGQVQSSGTSGAVTLDLDLTALVLPNGTVAAVPGDTWSFQAWHRDTVSGVATSNLTTGLTLSFR